MYPKHFYLPFLLMALPSVSSIDITLSKHEILLKIYTEDTFKVVLSNIPDVIPDSNLYLEVQHDDLIRINPQNVSLRDCKYDCEVTMEAIGAGHSEISARQTGDEHADFNFDNIVVKVTIQKSPELETFSVVIGWIYFLLWSVSFYPQFYYNYKRKSVVGFNFDFVTLNILGFCMYSTFNLGLYYIPEVKDEYQRRHPKGLNPVLMNDIVFAVHAAFINMCTYIQCFFYEKGNQRVSLMAKILFAIYGLFLFITIILAATDVVHWLDYLYYCSYVKLTITPIKYMPQVYMNYKRKSTVGWSIFTVLLDINGGVLSMLQMIVNSYNYDDWVSIFGDPTKFGIGLVSVFFDIIFLTQHFIIYKHNPSLLETGISKADEKEKNDTTKTHPL